MCNKAHKLFRQNESFYTIAHEGQLTVTFPFIIVGHQSIRTFTNAITVRGDAAAIEHILSICTDGAVV